MRSALVPACRISYAMPDSKNQEGLWLNLVDDPVPVPSDESSSHFVAFNTGNTGEHSRIRGGGVKDSFDLIEESGARPSPLGFEVLGGFL